MKNRYSKFESGKFEEIILKANRIFGLPEIFPELGLYAIDSKDINREIHIYLSPKDCKFRLYSKGSNLSEDRTDFVNLENKNIKGFLRFISRIGFNSCHIGEVVRYTYNCGGKPVVSIGANTLIGNLITY